MKIVITDYYYENLDIEREILKSIPDLELEDYHCKDEQQLCELTKDADAVIVQFAPITKKVIDSMKKCKVIARYAIGVDNIDLEAATKKGIYVVNIPDYSTDEVSNHAIALLLALSKKIVLMDKHVHEGKWDYTHSKPLYRMNGKTLGLVGFGRIPSMIAEKMKNFGLRIIFYDPIVGTVKATEHGIKSVSLETLLKESDYVSLHCPLNESTKHLISTEQFQQMKNSAVIINTARGAVVDEKALIEALKSGEIAGAGLDVLEDEPIKPNNELLKMDNVVITPHNAWYSEEAIVSLQRKVAEEVVRVLKDNSLPLNLVNKDVLKTQRG